ncbi:MFS transporter [Bacillus sp. ISL-57]|uniref:MFS transporter n=1 Tax=Bacillus sp. ISL-57 TaxID=2819135 RepID=UPI001BEBA599|nr:MFS transporter [Bacillus sp. ISL-57]MBT2719223.1 MFS transporter [Bacillus sp. ISL-57]
MNEQHLAQTSPKARHGNRFALIALAATFFGVGITEFISIGVLPAVANEFGISVSTAGLIVSMYALGVAVGGPILTSLTAKVPRRKVLLSVIVLFIIGHIITAAAPVFSIVLTGRIISAFAHGVFFAIGSTVAVSLVPKNRQASAIAFVFGGFTVATAIGAPFGTYISDMFGWRIPFYGIAFIGLIALILNAIAIPSQQLKIETPPSYKDQLKLVRNGRILLILAVTILGYGGTFVTFTYLSPILQDIMDINAKNVSIILFVYGVAIAIGNAIGGRLGDRKPLNALLNMFIVQAVILLIFTFTAPFKVVGLITVVAMGLLAFMSVPILQSYVLTLAQRYVPSAVDVASSLNIASFNGGIALGAYVGGLTTDIIGLQHTPWMAAVMVAGGVLLTFYSMVLEKKENK